MKQFIYLIVMLLPVTGFSQANVRKALEKVEKASDISMNITNVVKRNPSNRKVEMKVFTVNNLRPKYIREVAKAIEKDAGSATYDRLEMSQVTVVHVVRFENNKSDLNIVLTYGPGGGTLVVREDFTESKKQKPTKQQKQQKQQKPRTIQIGLLNIGELQELENLRQLKDLKDLKDLKKLVNSPDVTVYNYEYNYNGSSGQKIKVTNKNGVTHIYVNNN